VQGADFSSLLTVNILVVQHNSASARERKRRLSPSTVKDFSENVSAPTPATSTLHPRPFGGLLKGDEMTETSPGPGWWIASDGQWYPPKWDYHHHATGTGRSVDSAFQEAMPTLASFGEQGWEVVNCNVVQDAQVRIGHTVSLVFLLKRPRRG
jgi:hypothetical protein